jgi:hypothetical protein
VLGKKWAHSEVSAFESSRLCSTNNQSFIMRPLFPGHTRDAARREPLSRLRGNRRAACVCDRRPERWPGSGIQGRVDAFTQIVRDPRLQRYTADDTNDNLTWTGAEGGITDGRLNNASSCIGCHADGMNRSNNDIRDWLDEGGQRIPKGAHVTGDWVRTRRRWRAFASSILLPQKCGPR